MCNSSDPARDQKSAPRDEVEEKVAAIFAEVLKVEHVDCDEDFLSQGGDSLMVVEANQLIRKRFKLDIPLMEIVENSTVSLLAERIRSYQGAASPPRS